MRRANERASSISAAVPEPLSFAPGLAPLLSRCASTTMIWFERPSRTREHVFELHAAPAGDFRVKTLDFGVAGRTAQTGSATQDVAVARRRVPGARIGNSCSRTRWAVSVGGCAVELRLQVRLAAAVAGA